MISEIEFDAIALGTRPRLAAHALWDNMVRPDVVSVEQVPWHGEALTPEWLTSIFSESVPGAEALNVEVVGGDNGSSARRILAVEWNEAGRTASLPSRLFTKATPTLAMRLSAGKAAPAEGRFLTDLRPLLDIEAPRCLYTGRDDVSGRSLHLMEDLTTTSGAQFCRAESKIDRGQAEQVLDTLATLHGMFLGPYRDVDTSWLRTYESFFHAAARNGIEKGHDLAMSRAADVIPPAIRVHKSRIWPAALESLASHEQGPRTVIHSDVHLGNWYITESGTMGLGDWARVCRGFWGRDLAYALMTVLDIEDRRSWERELIDRYVQRLSEISGQQIEFDRAWSAYREQACLALLMWTPTLCPPPTLPDMQPEETSMRMIERITTAMDDHKVLSSSKP